MGQTENAICFKETDMRSFSCVLVIATAPLLLYMMLLRHVEILLKEMSGWLNAPKTCTFAAALCLATAALTGNFLGLERSVAFLSASILIIGLVVALGVIPVIMSKSRRIREELLGTVDKHGADPDQRTYAHMATHKNAPDSNDSLRLSTSPAEPMVPPFLSPLSSGSTHMGVSFRSSRLPM